MPEPDHVGSFEIGVANRAFVAYAAREGLSAASLLPEDEFIRPLLHSIADRLATYPMAPMAAARVPLHIGVIDHPEPNAFADWSDGAGYLVIHSGQIVSAAEAAIQMQDALGAFSQNPAGATGQDEAPALTTPLGVTSFLDHLRGVDDGQNLFKEQKDPQDPATRRATLFIAACIQFTYLHEFGHVVNGHLGWLSRHQRRPRLREVGLGRTEASADERQVLRFFEHEADVFALEVLLRSAYRNAANENELIVTMLAFLCTVFGWSVLEETPGLGGSQEHPQARDRMLALPLALMGVLTQIPEAAERVQAAVQRCDAIVSRVASKYPPFAMMRAIFSTEAVERADAIGGWMGEMDRLTADRTSNPLP